MNQIGENVNEIGENVNEIGENVKEDIGQDDSGRPIRDAIVQQDVVEIVKGSNTDTAIMQLDGNISLTEIETEQQGYIFFNFAQFLPRFFFSILIFY